MHYGGHGGFGFRGLPQPEVQVGPAVDIEQLGKDIERAQVSRPASKSGSGRCWGAGSKCSDAQADTQPMHCAVRPAELRLALLCNAGTSARAQPRLQAALDKLPGELKAQQANSAVVERRLQCEKGSWVLDGHAARVVLPREFAQVGAAAPAAASTKVKVKVIRPWASVGDAGSLALPAPMSGLPQPLISTFACLPTHACCAGVTGDSLARHPAVRCQCMPCAAPVAH